MMFSERAAQKQDSRWIISQHIARYLFLFSKCMLTFLSEYDSIFSPPKFNAGFTSNTI
jgi:hypothetical protein